MDKKQTNTLSYFWVNFKQKAINVKVFIILLILNMLAFPSLLLSAEYVKEYAFSLIICIFAYLLIFVGGIVIPCIQFDYLYNKNKVDMAYTQPMTRKQKFLSDYFSGLSLYLVPFMIQIFVSMLLHLLIKKENYPDYYSFRRIIALPGNDSFLALFFIFVVLLIALIFIYTLTTLTLSCTGNLFEAITASCYIHLLLPGMIAVPAFLFQGNLFGINLEEPIFTIMERMSPLGIGIYLLRNYGAVISGKILSWLLPTLVVIVVLFLLSFFIQVRRKAEEVTKPFVTKAFYYVIITSLTLILGSMLYMFELNIVQMLLTMAAIFLIFEAIVNRGFHKFYKSILRFAIIATCSFAVLTIVTHTELFGVVYHTNTADELDSIEVNYGGAFESFSWYNNTVKISESGNKQTILDLQQLLLQRHKEEEKGALSSATMNYAAIVRQNSGIEYSKIDYTLTSQRELTLTFHKTNGKSYSRSYSITFEDMLELISLELSDEFIDGKINALLEQDYYNDSQLTNPYQQNSYRLSEFFNKKVLEALRTDLKEATLEEYVTPSTSAQYILQSDYCNIVIQPTYKHTLAVIENFDLDFTMSDTNLNNLIQSYGISLSPPFEDFADISHVYFSSMIYSSDQNARYFDTYSEDIATLLRAANPQYVSKEASYRINIYGKSFVIPSEYNDLAKKVFDSLPAQESIYKEGFDR